MSARLLTAGAVTLAALGVAAVVAAVTLPSGSPAGAAAADAAAVPSVPTAVPAPDGSPTARPGAGASDRTTDADAAPVPVAARADAAWLTATAVATGVPERALAAYAGASLAVADTHPTCGVGWNTLAAIGEVESAHGALQGGRVDADGVVRPRVVGVALDGGPGLAAVPDTDGGALDGDPTWDRAVGPMQFLPATWAAHAPPDADVDRLDDAALVAAAYLCDAGGDLADPTGWIAAVRSYNPSDDYVLRVADAAGRLADAST